MVEVRDIQTNETPPENGDWVLIEKVGTKFVANGSAAGTRDVTFFKPGTFATADDAIAASVAWAVQNEVPVVYVRGKAGQ